MGAENQPIKLVPTKQRHVVYKNPWPFYQPNKSQQEDVLAKKKIFFGDFNARSGRIIFAFCFGN